MEYRINKIDTDLRREINEERSNQKIHGKKEIFINKDKKQEETRDQTTDQTKDHEQHLSREKYEVDAIKEKEIEVKESNLGHYIDIRK